MAASAIRDKRVFAQVGALNGAVVCTVENPTIRVGSNAFAQIDGEPLPNAPEYTVDLTARWDQPPDNGGRMFSATDWNLQFTLYRAREFTANGNFEWV